MSQGRKSRRRPGWLLWGLLVLLLPLVGYGGFIVWLYGSDDVDMARATTDAFRAEPAAEVHRLRGNVYLLTGGGMNVVAHVGPQGVTLVDTATDWAAPKMDAALRTITHLPVRTIINTHAHTDHRGGNGYFAAPGAMILAHRETDARMRAGDTTEADLPTRVFDETAELTSGDETIRITHIPDAHTQGDLVVYFVAADVLVAGDILINEGFPYIAEPTGATVDGYLRAQSDLIAMTGPDTIVIPGHGPAADRARLEDVHARLARIAGTVAYWRDKGLPARLILATYPTRGWPLSWQGIGMSHKFFVQIAYRSASGG
ncbi:MAG: MBL fold metallo-hydrolase [Rhodobacteraceae bacterium]|nr:MBL fold metallo-hydrolase [Paracoccaceae bacterium]